MPRLSSSQLGRTRRHRRIRATLSGTAARPRLAVYRSHKHIRVQLINDQLGQTILSADDQELKSAGTKSERAAAVGKLLAEKAVAKKITAVVFDRGGYRYHGRVKALAESARSGGLIF